MPVGIQVRNSQKNRHAHAQVLNIPVVFLFILIEKNKVNQRGGQKREPQQVRYNEIFAKRNVIVNDCVDDVEIMLYFIFQMTKSGHIKDPVHNNNPSVFVVRKPTPCLIFMKSQSLHLLFFKIYAAPLRALPFLNDNMYLPRLQTGIADFIIN